MSQYKTLYSWVSQYKDLQASRLLFLPQSVPTLLRAAKSPGSGALKDESQLFAIILLPDPVDYYKFAVKLSQSANCQTYQNGQHVKTVRTVRTLRTVGTVGTDGTDGAIRFVQFFMTVRFMRSAEL